MKSSYNFQSNKNNDKNNNNNNITQYHDLTIDTFNNHNTSCENIGLNITKRLRSKSVEMMIQYGNFDSSSSSHPMSPLSSPYPPKSP